MIKKKTKKLKSDLEDSHKKKLKLKQQDQNLHGKRVSTETTTVKTLNLQKKKRVVQKKRESFSEYGSNYEFLGHLCCAITCSTEAKE